MANSFFGFGTDIPESTKALGQGKLDEDLLTDNIEEEEEEYDALNDETFGIGADDGDWEEDHEKLAELIDKEKNSHSCSFFEESSFDESQREIVSKSISQLGLEDDLDDPAIMTVGHSHVSRPLDNIFRLSPPPPAILDPEFCGSPKTHSIWSTNHYLTSSKDSGVGSLLQISSYCQPYKHSSPCDISNEVFHSPVPTKAWTVEEVERNMLSSVKSQITSGGDWSPSSLHALSSSPFYSNCHSVGSNTTDSLKFSKNLGPFDNKCQLDSGSSSTSDASVLPSLPLPVSGGIRTLDDVESDILLKSRAATVDEVERNLKSEPSVISHSTGCEIPLSGTKPRPCQPLPSPVGTAPGLRPAGVFHSSPVAPIIPPPPGDRTSPNIVPGANIMPLGFPRRMMYDPVPPTISNNLDPRLGRLRYPMPGSVYFPFSLPHNPQCDPLKLGIFSYGDPKDFAYPRPVSHPFLPKMQGHRHLINWNKGPDGYNRKQSNSDDYAGLMTQKEKEWLLRIQLMLLKTDNPYVEDYYYTTYVSRKVAQEDDKGESNGPKLLLPERSKPENKTYVPTQFEGSLGKLQAVSVNFPRKVLDITVSRPLEDEEGKVVTNQSLLKYRRLLLDIEKMYNYLLEIDDEQKRILALPDDAHSPHVEAIARLTEKLVTNFSCETAALDDTFQNIMTIRKGRNLGIRTFKVFSKDQKMCFLAALFRCLPPIIRKDQNDMILLKNCNMITDIISTLSLSELVLLGESLENLPRSDVIITIVREKSNFICAFKNKFGSTAICSMLQQAEAIYSDKNSPDSEMQARWAKVVLHIVDVLCALPDSTIVPPLKPCIDLLSHFQRFAVDRDKFEVLKNKVQIFHADHANSSNSKV